MGPGDLREILKLLPKIEDKNLLVGLETSDDAGVVLINEEMAIVQTVDYITPVCDDPYKFGQIAVANALSDIYAMGAKPFTALNLCNFPVKSISKEALSEILLGGLDKIKESGALLIGGHTIKDEELKYGIAATGIINPQKIIRNSGAKPGDILIITKPIGTGVAIEAYKNHIIQEEEFNGILNIMSKLNKVASEDMLKYQTHACTDITGFGFAGHSITLAKESKISIEIELNKLPIYPLSLDLFKKGLSAKAAAVNKEEYMKYCYFDEKLKEYMKEILFDPQTSGGLLIAVSEKDGAFLLADLLRKEVIASAIGRAVEKRDYLLYIKE